MRVAVVVEQCLNRVPGGTGRYTRELTSASTRSRMARISAADLM